MKFATEDAPFLKYLARLKSHCGSASELHAHLKQALVNFKGAKISDSGQIAQILDLKHDQATGKNVVRSVNTISSEILHRSQEWVVNEFLQSLDTCDAEVHTQIIVLHSHEKDACYRGMPGFASPACKPCSWSVEMLFICHVLGIKLDLRPALVDALLSTMNTSSDKRLVDTWSSDVDFGCQFAADLGQLGMGNGHSPFVGQSYHTC